MCGPWVGRSSSCSSGRQLPVPPLRPTGPAHAQHVPGTQLGHAAQDRRARCLDTGEELAQPVARHRPIRERVRQQRLGFRAEEDTALERDVVQRLDPHPVADENQLLDARVPDRQCVHAIELLGQPLAPLEVGPEHHFGVTAGAEPVA